MTVKEVISPKAPMEAPREAPQTPITLLEPDAFRIGAPAPNASLIFLHGLGDTYKGWSFLAEALHSRVQHVNVVLPQAPTRHVSEFNRDTTAWFDFRRVDGKNGRNCQGVKDSVDHIKAVIKAEQDRGIESIILGGFSQGAAMALSCAISLDIKLAGFIAHSGFLTDENLDHQAKNLDTPVLMLHGLNDPIVPFQTSGQSAHAQMRSFGFTNVKLETYPGLPHSASPETIDEMLGFVERNSGR